MHLGSTWYCHLHLAIERVLKPAFDVYFISFTTGIFQHISAALFLINNIMGQIRIGYPFSSLLIRNMFSYVSQMEISPIQLPAFKIVDGLISSPKCPRSALPLFSGSAHNSNIPQKYLNFKRFLWNLQLKNWNKDIYEVSSYLYFHFLRLEVNKCDSKPGMQMFWCGSYALILFHCTSIFRRVLRAATYSFRFPQLSFCQYTFRFK